MENNKYTNYIKTLIKPLVSKATIPMPKIHVVNNTTNVNAQTDYKHYSISVNMASLHYLSRDELIGQLAHEIGHLYTYKHNRHFPYVTKKAQKLHIYMFSATVALVLFLFILYMFTSSVSNTVSIIVCLLWVLWVLFMDFTTKRVNKIKELTADKIGTELCGNADVLKSMVFYQKRTRLLHEYQGFTLYRMFFSNYPTIECRIKAMSKLLHD